jgi:ABC-2 type transport system ATP-binding protein
VSRREFWSHIHRLADEGTTVLVTTHYMDEAERCHRLAFIFRGALLDIGTPDEIVRRRELQVAELRVSDPAKAEAAFSSDPRVEEVSYYGHVLRLCVRSGADALSVAHELLSRAGLEAQAAERVRTTVEDAFVAMVRTDQREQQAQDPATRRQEAN